MFNSPSWSPQPSHATAGSQALTSKDRGASAFAWLAMPMGQAESSSHTSQTLLIYQGRLRLHGMHGRWLPALWKARWPLRGGTGNWSDCVALPPPRGLSSVPRAGCLESGAPTSHLPTNPGQILGILPALCLGLPGRALPRARAL